MVTPYFTQHRPPALVAMLPPIEQISYDDGSGGYHRSCSAAAAFTWAFISPGCTTAVRVVGSTSIAVIRSVETTRQPSTADAPPDSPLPAPRGTTGMPFAAANRTAACTSSVDPARTTASGTPASGSLARSHRYLSIRSGSVTTMSSPSSAASEARSTCTAAVM